jgi:hypothetical protein
MTSTRSTARSSALTVCPAKANGKKARVSKKVKVPRLWQAQQAPTSPPRTGWCGSSSTSSASAGTASRTRRTTDTWAPPGGLLTSDGARKPSFDVYAGAP